MFLSAVLIFEVVLLLAAARSRAESCGEICGGAGFGGASALSDCGGRGRGAGRLGGSGEVAGSGASGGGSSSCGVSTWGGAIGCGIGAVSGGGGVLTEGGAARTTCLAPQPEAARAAAKRNRNSRRLGILCIRYC